MLMIMVNIDKDMLERYLNQTSTVCSPLERGIYEKIMEKSSS